MPLATDPLAAFNAESERFAEEARRKEQMRAWDRQHAELLSEIERTLRALLNPFQGDDSREERDFARILRGFALALQATGVLDDALRTIPAEDSARAAIEVALYDGDLLVGKIIQVARSLLSNPGHLEQVRERWRSISETVKTIYQQRVKAEREREFPESKVETPPAGPAQPAPPAGDALPPANSSAGGPRGEEGGAETPADHAGNGGVDWQGLLLSPPLTAAEIAERLNQPIVLVERTLRYFRQQFDSGFIKINGDDSGNTYRHIMPDVLTHLQKWMAKRLKKSRRAAK